MDWGDLKRELEGILPDSKGYEWFDFPNNHDRIKPFKDNIWYGVRGFLQDGTLLLYPITVVKYGAGGEIYINGTSYDFINIAKSIDIAQKNTSLRFKDVLT